MWVLLSCYTLLMLEALNGKLNVYITTFVSSGGSAWLVIVDEGPK